MLPNISKCFPLKLMEGNCIPVFYSNEETTVEASKTSGEKGQFVLKKTWEFKYI